MKTLLRSLTKFVETALQLYAPLPFEFTADLHTLNAYLRSYSDSEEKQLESFVNRLAEKLQNKMKKLAIKDISANQSFDNVLRHYNSCTFKYPQLKLNLAEEDLNATCQALPERPIYSQRTQRSEQGGIKGNRHKFGSKHRKKINELKDNDMSIDKENLSINFNISIKAASQDKTLKGIKSEMELPSFDINNRKKSAEVSFKDKKEEGKNKVRYESNESRPSNTSSLKIKLKPKPSIDLSKIRQGLDSTLQLFSNQSQQLVQLMNDLIHPQESLAI